MDSHRIWDPDVETMPRDEILQLQLERLQVTLNRAMRNISFYRERFAPLDFVPDDVRSLDDLARLPLTSRLDLTEGYPYGFLAVPLREIVRIDTAPGLTHGPAVSAYTRNDLQHWGELTARVMTAAGINADSVVQIPFETGMFDGGFGFVRGAQLIGASVVSVPGGDYRKQVQVMHDYRTTVLVAMPSDATHLAEELERADLGPRGLWLQVALLGGEPWAETARAQIEDRLGVRAVDNYGVRIAAWPGLAAECEAREGLHINEDYFLAEVVDPDTLEPVPPGEEGELVITTLEREAAPVIRYRTGDVCAMVAEPCSCGRTFARMTRPSRRTDDTVVVRGIRLHAEAIGGTVERVLGVMTECQVAVGERALDDVEIRVAVPAQQAQSEQGLVVLSRSRGDLERELTAVLGLPVRVSIVERASLEGPQGAPSRLVDMRGRA
ncbi:MAG: phenylacetate--CoA ligase [candidate division WS1 bacterium]|nr:phenylacetate--CoA ligase [candidate division WS1 bacterium]